MFYGEEAKHGPGKALSDPSFEPTLDIPGLSKIVRLPEQSRLVFDSWNDTNGNILLWAPSANPE